MNSHPLEFVGCIRETVREPAWKVGDRGLKPQSGLNASFKETQRSFHDHT